MEQSSHFQRDENFVMIAGFANLFVQERHGLIQSLKPIYEYSMKFISQIHDFHYRQNKIM